MSTASPAALNHWPDGKCARAFWGQQELPPYRKLLADTTAWLDPRPGERWLDLGCGSGQLTRALWEKSGGRVAEVVALDCAASNARSVEKLGNLVQPQPAAGQLRFVHGDFSHGLGGWDDGHFDGAVSGLAIQYAESWSPERGCWTADAYEHLLAEVCRVLRPGGRFVFSVNVPNPAWYKVALTALHGFFVARRPRRYVRNAWRMLRYGAWLKREARRGRFHYLPAEAVMAKLAAAGFVAIEHRLSFVGQAYLFRCVKP
jgi:ubiquinone/menaquinone biosynthesis C-methylase UbiE